MSMTTELELAQRMKAAALKATPGIWKMEQENIWYTDADGYTKHLLYAYQGDDVDDEQDHINTQYIAEVSPANVLVLVEALEAALMRNAELERMESALRPVGVMSQKAYRRLENRESRFIALWPRPEIYLPRKRPDDGVIVFARTAAGVAVEGE